MAILHKLGKVLPRPVRQLLAMASDLPRVPLSSAHLALRDLRNPLHEVAETESALGRYAGLAGEHHFELLKEGRFSEAHFENLVRIALPADATALDIGANIGTHTVLLAKHLTAGHVFAFEPQSLTHAILQSNVVRNALDNVTVYPFAVSDETGRVIAIHLPVADTFNSGIAAVSDTSQLGDKTLTYRLDDLGLPQVDFVKMDVQGSEMRALQGAAALIARDRPLMFVEIEEQHLRALGTSSKEVMERMLGWDYVLFRAETDYPCDHICVPRERIAAFESDILPKLPFETTKVAGRRVSLQFMDHKAQNYAAVDVLE